MSKDTTEQFPPVAAPASAAHSKSQNGTTRRRRKSSGLGGEPRGDTAAPALATTANRLNLQPLPPTPREQKGTRGRKRRKVKSLFRRWKSISLRHTWLNPLVIMLAVLGFFFTNPTPSNPIYPAVMLSYPLPRKAGQSPDTPIQYGKGAHDFTFVAFYTVVLSFTREFLMQRLIRPLAIKGGIRSRAKQSRFMEQFYTAIYFAFYGPFGLYVMSRTPVWYFDTHGMYEGFPHRTHEGMVKAYYLLQASYWAQQMIVLCLLLEKPRKDFKELVAHHIITLSLIWLSYRFHFTYMGIAVYITHDISDFFLATSKTVNYLDLPVVGPYFGFFIFIWTYLRHYTNLRIIISMLPLPVPDLMRWLISLLPMAITKGSAPSPFLQRIQQPTFPDWRSEYATVGPYELNWDTQQYKCWIAQWITFGLLIALQSVNLFWLFLILRIAYRYIRTGEEKDDRSESESEEVETPIAESVTQRSEAPKMMLNGTPLPATGSESGGEKQSVGTRTSPRKKTAKSK